MQIIPETIRSLWDEWEIRVLVLVSLLWQIILIILGGRRKYSTNAYINFILWGMYLSADWLATVSLGNLASNQMGDSNCNNADTSKSKTGSREQQQQQLLQALWAPFLLLHLGGPDSITAYSLEDNSLWLRHLLGLIVQVSVAFYIFLLSLGNNALSLIAIPVFASGVIKYSERTLALWAASPDQIIQNSSRRPLQDLRAERVRDHIQRFGVEDEELKHVYIGYSLLPYLEELYANPRIKRISSYYKQLDYLWSEDVFKVVEAQLGFLFDVIYTKARIIYKPYGLVLRLISALSIVSALVAFHIIVIDNRNNTVDVVITYTLFVGAVSLEIYALVSLILSDWTILWLTKRNSSPLAHSLYSAISSCRRRCCHEKRWSGYMGQLNLVDFCLKETQAIGTHSSFKISFKFNLLRRKGHTKVDDDLKSLIYTEFVDTCTLLESPHDPNKALSERFKVFCERNSGLPGLEEDHSNFSIGETILTWHVATSICYYSNNSHAAAKDEEEARNKKRKASKKVSDYLLYILLMRPSMLPDLHGMIDAAVIITFNEAIRVFHQGDTRVENISEACRLVYQRRVPDDTPEWALIIRGSILASRLEDGFGDKYWEVIWEAWVLMLTRAAFRCGWASHAKQIPNGGEFLTHVSLLMADVGFLDKSLLA